MSTTIDQRVVEMRFDNKHFESNVSTTMSTLDKLKQKLNLDGASKGLENVNNAANKVNMNGLGSAVESVSAKFSALQVMGVTALANITNSAINAGKRIVSSLTIAPITTGFNEYELKMNSIQTIMAGTGESLATVNKYLNELNEYSDRTIYSFQDMTTNIGKFTNAGVKLEDAVMAIKGISNEAAVSGASATQASHAMYNLAQALSSGYVKLIDWKSIENAQMATMEFKNQLIETAVAAGTLKDVGDGMYETLEGKTLNATKGFNDTLQDQWMTSEVLITTLKKYADETTDIGAKATEAATKVKTFTQLMDTLKESAQSGWAQTWELLVGDFEEARAFFTELSDIFGGIIGKSADRRNDLLGGALNSKWDSFIEKVNEAGVSTDQFQKKLKEVGGDDLNLDGLIKKYGSFEKVMASGKISGSLIVKTLKELAGATKTVSTETEDLTSKFETYQKIVDEIWHGKWDNGKERVKNLEEAGYSYDIAQSLVNISDARKKHKITLEDFIKVQDKYSDAQLESIGYTEEEITALRELAEQAEKTGTPISELIADLEKPSGRELLLDSVMNIIKAIQRPLEAVGEALRNTFSVTSNDLYNVLEKINKFTKSLVMKGVLDVKTWKELDRFVSKFGIKFGKFEEKLTEVLDSNGVNVDELIEKYGSLGEAFEEGAISFDHIKEALLSFEGITESLLNGGENADKVRRTFEGLFAVIDIIATVLSGPLKFAFNVAKEVLGRMGLTILDVTARIGDAVVRFRDSIDKVVGSITSFVADHVTVWISKFKETEVFKTVAGWFESASKAISDALDNISNRVGNLTSSNTFSKLVYVFGAVSSAINSAAESIRNSKAFSAIVDGVLTVFGKVKDFFAGFKLPEFNIENLKTFSSDLVKIGEKIGGAGGGFIASIAGFGKHLRDNILSWNWTVFKETALEKFVNFWLKTGDKIKAAFEAGKEVANTIKEFLFGTQEVNLPVIMDAVTKFLWIITLIKTIKLLDTIVSPFDNVTDALKQFATALKWDAMAGAFKAMALALAAFAICIVIITNMGDMKKAWSAAGMLIALMVVMGAVVSAMGAFAAKGKGIDTAGAVAALLMLVGSIAILVYVVKEIDQLKLQDPVKTFGILFATLLAATMGVRMISKAGGSSFRSVAAILTLMAALKLILEVIESYDAFDWTGKSKAIDKMLQMMLALSVAIRIMSGGTKAGASSSGLAFAILAMVFSLKIMLSAIKEIATMSDEDLKRGGKVIAGLMAIMGALLAVANLTNKGTVLEKGQKSVNNFTGFAVALLAVVAAIWLLGKMDIDTLKQGGYAVGQVLILFTVLLSALGRSCSGLKMAPIIAMLVGFGLLMAEMAVIIKWLDSVPWQSSLSSAGALTALLLVMAGVLRTLTKHNIKAKNIIKWIGALTALTGIVAILAYVLQQTKDINPANAVGNAAALGILMGAMAGVLTVLTKHRNGAKSIYKWIGAMAVLGLVVAELAFVLYSIKQMNPVNAIGNAAALGILMITMAGVLAVINTVKVSTSTVGSIAALAAVAATLFILVEVLRSMNGVENAITNAIALSILAGALSICLIPLAAVGALAPTMVPGVLSLAALAAILGLLVLGLSAIKGVETARANAMTVANLAIVLSLCTIPLAVAGALAPSAIVGAGLLATLAAVLGLLVWGLSAIKGVETARANAITLANLAIVLSLCTLPLALAAVIAPVAIVGAGLLAALAVVLGLLVWGLSAIKDTETARANTETIIILLSSLTAMVLMIGSLGTNSLYAVAAINALITLVTRVGVLAAAVALLTGDGSLIEEGLGVLKMIAGGLGEVIAEFALGLTSTLPEVADNLSQFVSAAQPFIDTVKNVGDDVATGTSNLVKAILMLLVADFIAGVAELCNLSLVDLATELSGFAAGVMPFIVAMSQIKPETLTGIQSLCDGLAALTGATFWNSINDLIFGDGSLSAFGTSVSEFATCIKDSAEALKNITDEDVENIKRSAAAGTALAELNAAIPRQGGFLQDWIGSKDLAAFGQSAAAFADCLVNYSAKVSGKSIDTAAIQNSAEAGTHLADLNNAIPKQGGWAQTILGSQELATFGTSIVAFAGCLVDYSAKVSGKNIDAEAITASATAGQALSDLANVIPKQGGWAQTIMGEQDMATFGNSLKAFGTGLANYATAASTIDDTKIDAIKKSGVAIDELKLVMEKIPESGGWGEAIFGSKDGQSFGAALSSVASGIASYCSTAATISDDDITAIKNSKTAITELGTVLSNVPEASETQKTIGLVNAVDNLKSIASAINHISTAGYDYSGLGRLKSQISNVVSIVDNVDVGNVNVGFYNLSSAIKEAVACAKNMSKLNEYTYDGIGRFKSALTSLSGANIDGVIKALSGKGSDMASAMKSLTSAMSSGLSDGGSNVVNTMTKLVSRLYKAITDKAKDIKSAGKSLASNLVNGLKSEADAVSKAATSLGGKAVSGARDKYGAMVSAGTYLGEGLVSGIKSKETAVYNAGYRLGQKAVQGEKDGQKSNSPSKETIKAGKWLGEGLIVGIKRIGGAVYNAGKSMGRNAVGSISNSISKISSLVESGMDSQPTIRPVLDLSDVRSGIGTIGGMFNGTSLGVSANLRAITADMNARGQNGGNGDIISAIDKLRKDLGNVSGTTYQINGVTYDDGSNIKDAVSSIVRYAKIERRV